MIIKEPFIGKFINMRSVDEEDADFILKLRLDENNKRFISKTENDLEKQTLWIRQQKIRDNDYYFMFTDKGQQRLGVISVYNILDRRAESGRFISFGNGVQNMEAAIMHYDFAFQILDVDLIYYTVYKDNKIVANMWKRLGSQIICEKKVNNIDSYYFELSKERYEKVFRPNVMKVMNMLKYT